MVSPLRFQSSIRLLLFSLYSSTFSGAEPTCVMT